MIDLFIDGEDDILTDTEKAEELKHFSLHTSEVASSNTHIKCREKIFVAHQ